MHFYNISSCTKSAGQPRFERFYERCKGFRMLWVNAPVGNFFPMEVFAISKCIHVHVGQKLHGMTTRLFSINLIIC